MLWCGKSAIFMELRSWGYKSHGGAEPKVAKWWFSVLFSWPLLPVPLYLKKYSNANCIPYSCWKSFAGVFLEQVSKFCSMIPTTRYMSRRLISDYLMVKAGRFHREGHLPHLPWFRKWIPTIRGMSMDVSKLEHQVEIQQVIEALRSFVFLRTWSISKDSFTNLLHLLSVSVGSSQTNLLVKVTVLQLERAVEWKDSLVPGEEKELEVPAEAQEKLRELFKKYSTSQKLIFPYFPWIAGQPSCQLLVFLHHQAPSLCFSPSWLGTFL